MGVHVDFKVEKMSMTVMETRESLRINHGHQVSLYFRSEFMCFFNGVDFPFYVIY